MGVVFVIGVLPFAAALGVILLGVIFDAAFAAGLGAGFAAFAVFTTLAVLAVVAALAVLAAFGFFFAAFLFAMINYDAFAYAL
jgi:hypothetical protein